MLKYDVKVCSEITVSCERNYWHVKSRATLRLKSKERVCGAERAVLQNVDQGRGVQRARVRNMREMGARSSVKSWVFSPYQTAEGSGENTAR